ncbi:MAG: hypothetical protein K2X93_04140 [Candidatus Obscuribacterales bacterium]|nr:hypothetical protein [Candidatus Obscuribacterales bacterium]
MNALNAKLYLYVHTHWDREWYWAFERYRTVLITAMRLVVDALEKGDLPNFHLDGQSCALDDFLELEPGYEDRFKRLIAERRLSVGPWYVLADQMLVGGESLVRNMEYGMDRTRRLGPPMMVGYCPDTFGHSQDLPRILKGFGIDNAIVWRGVPELEHGPEFFWRSPDGSEVVATLLAKGYHQTLFHEAEGSVEKTKIDTIVENMLQWLGFKLNVETGKIERNDDGSPVMSSNLSGCLVPVGGDHQKPPANLTNIITQAERRLTELLADPDNVEYLSAVDLDPVLLTDYTWLAANAVRNSDNGIDVIEGELRENTSALAHAAGYMLPGVLSTRLYLKRANRMIEHRLTRLCEPVNSMMTLMGLTRYPAVELANAWRYLLKNHPHDSMCGCSVDEVHAEMMTRFASIDQIIDVLDQRCGQELLVPGVHEWSLRHADDPKAQYENAGFGRGMVTLLDPDVPVEGVAIFNTSTDLVSTPIPITLPIPEKYLPKQNSAASGTISGTRIREAADSYFSEVLSKAKLYQIDSTGYEMELFGESCGVPLYKDVYYLNGWIWANDIPQIGCVQRKLSDMGVGPQLPPADASARSLSNGIFNLKVGPDGAITVDYIKDGSSSSFPLNHSWRDVADAGDSYNFDPIPNDTPVTGRVKSVDVLQGGPLVSSLRIVYEIELPTSIVVDESKDSGVEFLVSFKRSDSMIVHEIETIVSLRRGVPIVFFDSKFNNRSTDHRLEVVFGTGSPIKSTWSENHMSLVKRPVENPAAKLPVEKYTEAPLDRYPCQRFFVANGQVFFNLGMPEYGAEDKVVTMTALRAISMLSRRRLMTRGGGAGPYLTVPQGNCIGDNRISYGWAPLAVLASSASTEAEDLSDQQRSLAFSLADAFEGSLWLSPLTPASKDLGFEGSILSVDNPHIRCTAFYSRDRGRNFFVRLLNVADSAQSATVKNGASKFQAHVRRVNLKGEGQSDPQSLDQPMKLSFGRNELITLQIAVAK